tara:strand:- start:486 stop:950 length:465 start_codon:yes stop_codon:yes gene_type:complete
MIIECPSCGKKFNVRDDQIPIKGRLLQCSNCKHEWFYTKNTNLIGEDINEQSNDEITQESFGILDNDEDMYNEVIVEDKPAKLEKLETGKKLENKQLNFFKLLLVFIISFTSFILIVDTFITQISNYVPFAEKYLDNLYQSIIDISLFFQNLIK